MGYCYIPAYPFGPWQRLRYGGITVLLDYTNKPPIGAGGNLLEQWGYDRYLDPEYLTKPQINYAGYSQFDGPAHRAPHRFEWRFDSLSAENYRLLRAIWLRSLADKQPVRLEDGRYLLDEPAPRTRAQVSPDINYTVPTVAGMATYFPKFDVILDIGRERSISANAYSLSMTAVEYNPAEPVPTGQDS